MNVPELLFKYSDITLSVTIPALHPQSKIIPGGLSWSPGSRASAVGLVPGGCRHHPHHHFRRLR